MRGGHRVDDSRDHLRPVTDDDTALRILRRLDRTSQRNLAEHAALFDVFRAAEAWLEGYAAHWENTAAMLPEERALLAAIERARGTLRS